MPLLVTMAGSSSEHGSTDANGAAVVVGAAKVCEVGTDAVDDDGLGLPDVPVEQAAATIATGDKIMTNRRFTSLPIPRM
jgi:hypothetical protein